MVGVCSPKITGNLYLLIGQTTRQNSNSLPPQNVYKAIDSLQPIPRESNDKDVAAMLDELTIEAIMRNLFLSSSNMT